MRIESILIAGLLSGTVFSEAVKPIPHKAKQVASLVEQNNQEIFPIPDVIRHDVDFWAKIYREWDTDQVVVYDSPTKVVFSVVNLPRVEFGLSSAKYRKDVQKEVSEIQSILNKIAKGEDLSNENPKAGKLYEIVKQNNLLKETDLSSRLRQQNGLRSQFEFGLKMSGRYADEMKAVLKSQSLPDDLLAVVFVESLFLLTASSHAGASGPWGIVKETAISSGIHVNKFTDERIDPVVSTWGAARYLKKAKEGLLEWPLVLTAYNYGYPGMMRAVNNLGTKDFSVILAKHDSPIFKYASKNYYAEFLAALDTFRNQDKYFPGLAKENRWEYEIVQVQRPVLVSDLLMVQAINREDLSRLNPSLTHLTITGSEVIPSDYALRVPKGQSDRFYAQVKKIPTSKRNAAGLKVSSKYHARGKETLEMIAKLFGISREFLSERMGKPPEYKPHGPVIIRSQAHLFSPLLEINKNMLTSLSSGQTLEKPAEIISPVK